MVNRLANATSPYLLQHAENPVDWQEWGPEAFDEARRRDVPVLLSVGYAACHWCHVMAHESFEDVETAHEMNAGFVNVKVDREERPDVDALYMQATVALTGQGGWPMTVFLTPDGRPFYAGTYFPPRPAHGRPSFRQLLAAIGDTWRERRGEVLDAGQRITEALAQRGPAGAAGGGVPTSDDLGRAVRLLAREHDAERGGFGGAPKFPPSMVLEWLLRHAAREGVQDDTAGLALAMAENTLRRMAFSGTYDQVEGGFARYAVDADWVVPHFEKMLYDNALLARVYLHWWRLTGAATGRRIAEETCDFLVARLGTADGGMASSLDADTLVEGRGGPRNLEGATYVWTPTQLVDVLGPDDGAWVAELTGVTPSGTFEHGTSTLQLLRDVWASDTSVPAPELGQPSDAKTASWRELGQPSSGRGGLVEGKPDEAERWTAARERLRQARAERPQPGRDDKVVAAWNGLAIAALAECGALLDRPGLLDAARAAADLLLRVHLVDGRLRRVSRDGVVGAPEGVLEDYGDVVEGLVALHAATGEARWLRAAGDLVERMLQLFWREGEADARDEPEPDDVAPGNAERSVSGSAAGHFTDVPYASPDPVLHGAAGGRVGAADPTDNAYPSGVFAAAGALLSWAALTGDARCREVAEQALSAARQIGAAAPRFAGWGLAVCEAVLDGPREVAVVGEPDDESARSLRLESLLGSAPGLVVAAGAPGQRPVVPLLEGRGLRHGVAAAYPCRGFVCDLPVTSPEQLRPFTRPR
ncbi:MAG TPA: thioredoxin domain-containing protein [Actinomycetales bacterium]|nr:thioredoxin domain-containing protein [Actinomycetales bacterium]